MSAALAISPQVVHVTERDESLRQRISRGLEAAGFTVAPPGDLTAAGESAGSSLPAAAMAVVDRERAADALERLRSAALGRLTGHLTHELRNALTSIRCYTELLADSELPANVRDFVTEVEAGIDRMAALTSEWVDLAHGRNATACPNLDLKHLVALLQSIGLGKRIRFVAELDELAGVARVDPQRLQALLFVLAGELVSRAPRVVRVSTAVVGDSLQIGIVAEGCDRPAEQWVDVAAIAGAIEGGRIAREAGETPGFVVELPIARED
jgi:signal transduction histidine kinase